MKFVENWASSFLENNKNINIRLKIMTYIKPEHFFLFTSNMS